MSLMKTSDRKREANARNAQRSTGPKTAEGRERSSRNAVTHGCSAARIHKPVRHESADHFNTILEGLMNSWQPVDDMESMLVKGIAQAWIRIERSERWESSVLTGIMETRERIIGQKLKVQPGELDDDLGCCIAMTDKHGSVMWKQVERHSNKAWRDWHRAVETLRKMQNTRKQEERRSQQAAEVAPVAAPSPATPETPDSQPETRPAEPTSSTTATDVGSFCTDAVQPSMLPHIPVEFSKGDPEWTV